MNTFAVLSFKSIWTIAVIARHGVTAFSSILTRTAVAVIHGYKGKKKESTAARMSSSCINICIVQLVRNFKPIEDNLV